MAAPSAVQVYAKNLNVAQPTGLTTATIKMLLTTSLYTPDTTNTGHAALADVTNELSQANGYVTGGVTLTSPTVTTFSTTGYKFSTGNASWTASSSSISPWRTGVIYVQGSLWGVTSPLLGMFTGDSTPTDVPATAAGNTLQITVPANGWFTVTRT